MVEKISVQIALEGGAEIQRQLEGIGEAGQKAFGELAQSAEQVGGFKNLKPEEVTQKLKDMGVTGVDALEKIQKAVTSAANLEKVVQGVASVETALLSLAKTAGVVGLAVGAAFAAMAKPTIAFAEAINKASDQAVKLGLSLEQFKSLQADFQNFGVTGEAAAAGFAKFQQELQKAAQADPGSNLALFGQNADVARQQMDRFLEQLRQMPDSLQRTNLAISQLGEKAGTQFIQGLRAAEGSMSADERKAYELGQAVDRLSSAWAKFGSLAFAPGLTAAIDVATTAVQALTKAFSGLQQIGQSDLGQKAASTLQNAFTGLDQIIATVVAGIAKGMGASAAQVEALRQAILGTGQAGQQAGQQAAAGIKLIADPLTGMPIAVNASTQSVQQFGQTTQQAGQQAAAGIKLITDPLTGLPKAVSATNEAIATTGATAQQAGQQATAGFQVWNEELGKAVPATQATANASQTAFQTITTAVQGAGTAISDFISKIAGITWEAISSVGVAAWNALTGAIQNAINKLLEWIGLKEKSGGGGGGGGSAPGKARGGLIGGRGTGTSDSNLAWLSRGEFVIRAAAVRQFGAAFFAALNGGRIPGFADGGSVGGGSSILSGFINSMGRAIGDVKNIWDALINGMQGVYQTILKSSETIVQTTEQTLSQVVRESDTVVRATVASLERLQLTLGTILGETVTALQQGKARGGLIGGRGTGTSDSNLAWLSRGEFVINAAAVRQFGAGFFAALNAGMLPGFALGGLVPRPAFAGGGSVGGGNHVTIQFPGLPPVGGLRASSAVVEQLQRAAALAQVRSGGRKPSRYS